MIIILKYLHSWDSHGFCGFLGDSPELCAQCLDGALDLGPGAARGDDAGAARAAGAT